MKEADDENEAQGTSKEATRGSIAHTRGLGVVGVPVLARPLLVGTIQRPDRHVNLNPAQNFPPSFFFTTSGGGSSDSGDVRYFPGNVVGGVEMRRLKDLLTTQRLMALQFVLILVLFVLVLTDQQDTSTEAVTESRRSPVQPVAPIESFSQSRSRQLVPARNTFWETVEAERLETRLSDLERAEADREWEAKWGIADD